MALRGKCGQQPKKGHRSIFDKHPFVQKGTLEDTFLKRKKNIV